jgi:acyl-CoA synthetase (AMP-forming)/AMP-acid ligase II
LGNLAAWSAGSAILYAAEGFDPVRALRASSEEKATALHGVPAHFVAELGVLKQLKAAQRTGDWYQVLSQGIRQDEDWQFNLRTGFTSGSTVPIELMRSIMDPNLLGAQEQTSVYGMTETSPVSFACDTQASIKRRCETVGRVIPHAHAKIVSPEDEDGKPLPIGEIGELCTSGYIVMKGYWNDKKQTNEVLQYHPDEPDILWMRTGDLGVLDKDGYAEIRGRVKDLIIRGGENLTAVEIEK